MSELEHTIQEQLAQHKIQSEPQKTMPFQSWPWRQPKSQALKCDFFLPQGNIYVEVKGFMTIHAMAKMSWFCRQKELSYYILQGTEEDWNPYIDSPQGIVRGVLPSSKKKIREQNISHQVQELAWLIHNAPTKASTLSLARLKDYIGARISEYQSWNQEWY
jgi:hypothetical protein